MLQRQTKFFLVIGVLFVLVIVLWVAEYAKPADPTQQVYEDDRADLGNPKATIVITNYFDFYCSHCKEADKSLGRILDQYSDRVLIKYRYFPITQPSVMAAVAAECAGTQGKFLPYHNLLFSRFSGTAFTAETLRQLASTAGLDGEQFQECLDSQQTAPAVYYDLRLATGRGIVAVPTIFVNDVEVEAENLVAEVERLLAQ
ncbi:thioredoxin domain-containing protein [Candidatus Falkowbacteria bacterium]|nr:thioredoxin domain-containing protein [Candidatus Falkowbacteria bacterium]